LEAASIAAEGVVSLRPKRLPREAVSDEHRDRGDDDRGLTPAQREFARWLIREAIREWHEEQAQRDR
jgi:hypothetical protein